MKKSYAEMMSGAEAPTMDNYLSLSEEEKLIIREIRRNKALDAMRNLEAIDDVITANKEQGQVEVKDKKADAYVVTVKHAKGTTCSYVPLEAGSYNCMFCSAKFERSSAAREHVDEKHMRVENFKCSACSFGHYYEDRVKMHIELSHKGSSLSSEASKRSYHSKVKNRKDLYNVVLTNMPLPEEQDREPEENNNSPAPAGEYAPYLPPAPKRARLQSEQEETPASSQQENSGVELEVKLVPVKGKTVALYKCPYCAMWNSSKETAYEHIRKQHSKKQELQGKARNVEQRLAFHRDTYERAFSKLLQAQPVDLKGGKCPYPGCPARLSGAYDMRMHYGSKHFNLKRFQCLDCQQAYRSNVALTAHFNESSQEECKVKGMAKKQQRDNSSGQQSGLAEEEESARQSNNIEEAGMKEVQERFDLQRETYEQQKTALMKKLPHRLRLGKCRLNGCKQFSDSIPKQVRHYLREHGQLTRWTCFDCGLSTLKTNTALVKHFKENTREMCLEKGGWRPKINLEKPKPVSKSPEQQRAEARLQDQTSEYSQRRLKILGKLTKSSKQCSECHFHGNSQEQAEDHYVEEHHNLRRWSCFDCGDTFPKRDALMRHFQTMKVEQCIQEHLNGNNIAQSTENKASVQIKQEQIQPPEDSVDPVEEASAVFNQEHHDEEMITSDLP